MEGEGKAINIDGVEGNYERDHHELATIKPTTWELVLRLLAFVLTIAAAIVIGLDKQSKVVPIKLVDSLPPLNIAVYAKWHYLSAFV
ncbi:CASP-like protein 6-like [Trifolium pratense]|uniref:CASP-like protein n=1 Tax=Trifolium pratense TaxID=57577 RepID=A0A2K3LDH8_TRIPR|nr:CASP-like protein 6-like [Trifolium pratense]